MSEQELTDEILKETFKKLACACWLAGEWEDFKKFTTGLRGKDAQLMLQAIQGFEITFGNMRSWLEYVYRHSEKF